MAYRVLWAGFAFAWSVAPDALAATLSGPGLKIRFWRRSRPSLWMKPPASIFSPNWAGVFRRCLAGSRVAGKRQCNLAPAFAIASSATKPNIPDSSDRTMPAHSQSASPSRPAVSASASVALSVQEQETALTLATLPGRARIDMAVVTNDIYTAEDAKFLVAHSALAAERVIGVETGGCPHTAIREDARSIWRPSIGCNGPFPASS